MTDIKRLAIEIFSAACLYDNESCTADNQASPNLKKLSVLAKDFSAEVRSLLKGESVTSGDVK